MTEEITDDDKHNAVNAGSVTLTPTFPCPKCPDKEPFKNKNALNMHTMRVHTRAGRQGAMWKRDETKEQRLVRRRAYQKTLRERYKKEGKDSRGQLRPPGWKPRKSPTSAKSKFGAKWTPARRKRFRATWAAKNSKLEARLEHINNSEPKEDPREFINFCPNCKYELVPHYLAARIVSTRAK